MHLDDLLSRYDAARAAGENPTPEDLCRETPELLEPLRYHVRALQAMKGLPTLKAPASGPCEGATVESYLRVKYLHAKGGLGEVYLAHDERLGRDVALKVISSARRQDFEREAAITGKLEHPGIVPVHGVGTAEDGRSCYTMRFVAGQTLGEAVAAFHTEKQALARSNPQFRQLLSRLVQISQTIAFAHSRGVIHRDLKPGNVILGEFGETLVVDWGLAQDLSEPGASATGGVVGTPAFMSPEQAAGEACTTATDVFALGGLLYTVLTGAAPYAGLSGAELSRRMLEADVPRRGVVPPALDAVCRKAMAREPKDRFASAKDFGDELERWLADESLESARDTLPVRLRRWTRRNRLLVTTAAVGVGVALVSLGIATGMLSSKNRALSDAIGLADEREHEAVANFRLACDAVDRFTINVTQDPQLKAQNLGKLRKDLLEGVKLFYRDLAEKRRDDPAVRQQIFKAHLRLGAINNELGDRDAAEAEFRRALDFARDWPGERDRQQLLDEGDAWMGISNVHSHFYRQAEAVETARRSLECRVKAVGADPADPFDRWMVAAAHLQVANLLADHHGNVPEAYAEFERAIDLSRRNYEANPQAVGLWRVLPAALGRRGLMKAKAKQTVEAEADMRAARDLAKLAVTDSAGPDMREFRQELADVCINLANIYLRTGRPADAEESYALGLNLYERLIEDQPTILKYRRGKSTCLYNLGELRFQAGQTADADQLWVQCLEQRRTILAASPKTVDYRFDLVRVHCRLSETAVLRKDEAAARKHLLAAEESLRPGSIDAKTRASVASYWKDAVKLPTLAETAWSHMLDLARDLIRDGSPVQAMQVLKMLSDSGGLKDAARRARLDSADFTALKSDASFQSLLMR